MTKNVFGGLLGLLLLAGCQNSINTTGSDPALFNPMTDQRFVTDSFLRDRLKLIQIDQGTTPEGFLQVQVTALNDRVGFFSESWSTLTGGNPYKIDYRFLWFDEGGFAVDSNMAIWQEVITRPGEPVLFVGTAPSAKCKNFMLSVKESDN